MKYVEIQSTKNIAVTSGLAHEDLTNYNLQNVKDDLIKVNAQWPKDTVLIKEGKFLYPSRMAEWETVKCLVKDGVLTIGKEVDNEDNLDVEEKERLSRDQEKVKNATYESTTVYKRKSPVKKTLEEAAGE